jgi:hypothetical protein
MSKHKNVENSNVESKKCRKYRKSSFGRRKSFNTFISLKKFLPTEKENYTNNK